VGRVKIKKKKKLWGDGGEQSRKTKNDAENEKETALQACEDTQQREKIGGEEKSKIRPQTKKKNSRKIRPSLLAGAAQRTQKRPHRRGK